MVFLTYHANFYATMRGQPTVGEIPKERNGKERVMASTTTAAVFKRNLGTGETATAAVFLPLLLPSSSFCPAESHFLGLTWGGENCTLEWVPVMLGPTQNCCRGKIESNFRILRRLTSRGHETRNLICPSSLFGGGEFLLLTLA